MQELNFIMMKPQFFNQIILPGKDTSISSGLLTFLFFMTICSTHPVTGGTGIK